MNLPQRVLPEQPLAYLLRSGGRQTSTHIILAIFTENNTDPCRGISPSACRPDNPDRRPGL